MEAGTPSKEELLALREQERALLEQERQRNRKTTFAEYLQACHRFVTRPLTIQTDRSLTTKGSITSPNGRICPTFLQPWDFRSLQQPFFNEVYRFFHPSSDSSMRVFPPLIVIEDRGQQACFRPLASEADLVRHKEAEVENPVKEIIDQLAQIPAARDRFALGDGIVFENHINTITEEPGQRLSDSARGVRADQNCVYARNGSRETYERAGRGCTTCYYTRGPGGKAPIRCRIIVMCRPGPAV